MNLSSADFDYVRRFTLRYPISADLDHLPALGPADRCKLLAMVLMRTGDRELLLQGRANGFFDRLKVETSSRLNAGGGAASDGFAPTTVALARLHELARPL